MNTGWLFCLNKKADKIKKEDKLSPWKISCKFIKIFESDIFKRLIDKLTIKNYYLINKYDL